MKTNALQRLRIHVSLNRQVTADAGESIPSFFEQLSLDLTDAHVEHLTFEKSIVAVASLKGLIQILSDQSWELTKEKGKEASLERQEVTIKLEATDDTHVSIHRS
jgi:hypothetical protein